MAFSNAEKQQHGQSAQNSLENILKRCLSTGYLKQIYNNYRTGKDGYSNKSQFYAPFLIEFHNDTKWALFTTTSMRTDRIKGQQWDALNLKEVDKNITYVYLVYPDGLSTRENNSFIQQNNKYINHKEYSAIDAIVSQDQIFNMIESYALKDLSNGKFLLTIITTTLWLFIEFNNTVSSFYLQPMEALEHLLAGHILRKGEDKVFN